MANKSKIVLGTLLAAMALASPHAALAVTYTASHWELRALRITDGVKQPGDQSLGADFTNVQDCVKAAMMMPSPPKGGDFDGHKVVYGYACIRVDIQVEDPGTP